MDPSLLGLQNMYRKCQEVKLLVKMVILWVLKIGKFIIRMNKNQIKK